MLSGGSWFAVHSPAHGLILLCIAITLLVQKSASVVVPSSNCYVIDNSSRIFYFTDLMGHHFEYEGKGSPDVVVRFCKDVESRSQQGYVDFGHFSVSSYFVSGTGHVNFVQGFHKGDLMNCEHTYDKMGRAAKVSLGASAVLLMILQCAESLLSLLYVVESLVYEYLRVSQLGFIAVPGKSFETEQTHVSLYMTAVASLSSLVGKPDVKVNPVTGLVVELSGSGTNGRQPTTLSPTVLTVSWRCEQARDIPYEVAISIPVDGYDPVEFILTKKCEYKQDKEGEAVRGWATFGVLSCIFIVLSTGFCCGGFIYKTRVEHQHGLDALPGMTILAACLETVSEGERGGYTQAENSPFINQTSWDHVPVSTQPTQKTSRNYGSI